MTRALLLSSAVLVALVPAVSQCEKAPERKEVPMSDDAGSFLVETRIESALGEADGFRVAQDGSWWTYGTVQTVFNPATKAVEFRDGPRQWRKEQARLSEGDLKRLKDALGAAGILGRTEGPPRRDPEVQVHDGTTATWRFALGGRTGQATWMPDVDPMPAAVKTLQPLVDEMIFRAQQRWLNSLGLEHTPVTE